MFILQENSILDIEFREKNLETGVFDELEKSSLSGNLADITYVSANSSINDNFDDIASDNEAVSSLDWATEVDRQNLSDVENNTTDEQGCELPFKIRRSHAFRRRQSALKRMLTSESSQSSTKTSGGRNDGASGGASGGASSSSAPPDNKKPRKNGSTPPNKAPKDKDSDKDKDKRRKEEKERKDKEWAEIVRDTMKVEVKANNGAKLSTTDFSRINRQSVLVMMKLKIPGGDNWLIGKQGVQQHGLYYRVYNQATIDTMKQVIPHIDPKCKENPNADYTYEVFGPGESKTFILRWRLCLDFDDWPTEQLNDAMLWVNEDLYKNKVKDESTDTFRDGLIRVVGKDNGNYSKRRDKELLKKEPGKGNKTWLVEIEDCLWDRLVEVKKGVLKIGTSSAPLDGYDLKEHVKMFLAGEQRPNRPTEFRGNIRSQKKADKEAAKAAAQQATLTDDDDLLNQEEDDLC